MGWLGDLLDFFGAWAVDIDDDEKPKKCRHEWRIEHDDGSMTKAARVCAKCGKREVW